MSEINKKLVELVEKRDRIPDEFWIKSENGHDVIWVLDQEDGTAGSYETSQERFGITRNGDIIWGFSSGCSCWIGWGSDDYCPTVSIKEFVVDMFSSSRSESADKWEEETQANLVDFLTLVSDKIEPQDVLNVKNAEIRRYLIKRVGYENIKDTVKAEVIHQDGDSELLKFKNGEMYVKVKDSSTERDYLLFVKGGHKTCRSAIAWTFGLEEEEYKPIIET